MLVLKNRKKLSISGFTILELLVVLAMIAILTAIVVPSYVNFLKESRTKTDLANISILNRCTQYYRIDVTYSPDPFAVSTNTSEFLIKELVDNRYLENTVEPLSANAEFKWDFDYSTWVYYVDGAATGDAIFISFVDHITESSLQYETFLSTSTSWGSASTLYKPNTWNGYLEKLLERGDVESNVRRDEDSGHNTIDYQNPYSSKETVVNYNNWIWFQSRYAEYIPPAILITNQDSFSPDSTSSMLEDNVDYLRGTMVIYKSKVSGTANDQAVVYYVLDDGSKSTIYGISDIFE